MASLAWPGGPGYSLSFPLFGFVRTRFLVSFWRRGHVDRPARLVGDRGALGDQRERLRPQHVGGDGAELAQVAELLDQPVGRDANPVRLLGDVGAELLRAYRQLLLSGQLVQDEPGLDRSA